MKAKLFMAFVAVLFAATLASCDNDDDKGIYFTQDEVVGDIITGKKINIGNSLSLYAGYSTRLNVHGQSGNIQATTSDASIATVEADNSGGYNDGHLTITVNGKSEGMATIIITDGGNKTAELTIQVMNPTRAKYVRTNVYKDEVYVSGVTDSEAAAIKEEIISSRACEQSYELEIKPSNPASSRLMLHVYDTAGKLLYDMYGKQPSLAGSSFELYKVGDDNTFGYYRFGDGEITIDLSQMYRAKYPEIEVEMLLSVKKEDQSSSEQYSVKDIAWQDDCPYDIYKIYPRGGTEEVELYSGIKTEFHSVWLERNTFSPSDKFYNNIMYMATSALVADSISEDAAFRVPNLRHIYTSSDGNTKSFNIDDILTYGELNYMCNEAPIGTKMTFGLYLLNPEQKALQKIDVTFVKVEKPQN